MPTLARRIQTPVQRSRIARRLHRSAAARRQLTATEEKSDARGRHVQTGNQAAREAVSQWRCDHACGCCCGCCGCGCCCCARASSARHSYASGRFAIAQRCFWHNSRHPAHLCHMPLPRVCVCVPQASLAVCVGRCTRALPRAKSEERWRCVHARPAVAAQLHYCSEREEDGAGARPDAHMYMSRIRQTRPSAWQLLIVWPPLTHSTHSTAHLSNKQDDLRIRTPSPWRRSISQPSRTRRPRAATASTAPPR